MDSRQKMSVDVGKGDREVTDDDLKDPGRMTTDATPTDNRS